MTRKTISAAGYIIQDKQGAAIYGAGKTVDEAWAEVVEGCAPFHDAFGNEIDADTAYEQNFKTYGATADLLAQIEKRGGAIAWGIIGAVACTTEEEDAYFA